jgi:hypothetical protein
MPHDNKDSRATEGIRMSEKHEFVAVALDLARDLCRLIMGGTYQERRRGQRPGC